MRIDHKAPIAGVKPRTVQKVMGRWPSGILDAETFTAEAKLPHDTASGLVAELLARGYVEPHDEAGDEWIVTELGTRFVSTPLIPRFPAADGRKLVEDLIQRALAIHVDESHNAIISEIQLFGSLLTGGDEGGLVGDVDLAVSTRPRDLGDDMKAAWREVRDTVPQRWARVEMAQFRFPPERELRRLKGSDKRLSFTFTMVVEDQLKAPRVTIYDSRYAAVAPVVALPWSEAGA